MTAKKRKLRIFLCHSSQDKTIVRELYQRLLAEGWLDPWLDEEKLLPGQNWDMEIEKAVETTDIVIVCLSKNSVSKEGYIQRELKFVLDIALEKPEDTIFIIPLRLEDCEPPRRLRVWQYANYFPASERENSFVRLLASLKNRAISIDALTKDDLRYSEIANEILLNENLPNVEPNKIIKKDIISFPDETICKSIDHWLEYTAPRRHRQGTSTRTIFDKDKMLGFIEADDFVDQCIQYLETRGINLYIIDAVTLLKQRKINIEILTPIDNRRIIVFVRKINAVQESDQMIIYGLWEKCLSPNGLASQEKPISLAVSFIPFIESFEHIQKYDLLEKINDRLQIISMTP